MMLQKLAEKKRAPVSRVTKKANTYIDIDKSPHDYKAQGVDDAFFAPGPALSFKAFVKGTARNGQEYVRQKSLPHQNMVSDDGKPLDGRRARLAAVLATSDGVSEGGKGKKHFKGNKRAKQRSGKGYE